MSLTGVRPITSGDLADLRALLAADPIANAFVESRVSVAGADPWRLGGELWGYFADGELRAAAYLGANLIPVQTDAAARAAFAAKLRLMPRRSSSLVGPAGEVLDLWRLLEPSWGPAREVRARQPLMAIDGPPAVDPDPLVCATQIEQLSTLVPACVAMFTEEVGVSPTSNGMGDAYRARVAELVRAGRSLSRIEGRSVAFKAELGIVASSSTQIQGVFVDPSRRGEGLAAPGMAAVVDYCRERFVPVVCLYVNDYNTPARKAYARVGFETVGEFATVLF